ncbi:hypothetical protein MCEMIE11_00561 [Burkholderiales bacterium]
MDTNRATKSKNRAVITYVVLVALFVLIFGGLSLLSLFLDNVKL